MSGSPALKSVPPQPVTQLTLDLLAEPPPDFANFVEGSNGECVALLRALAAGERSQRSAYLWGLPGSGRSHLLRATAAAAGATARLLAPDSPADAFALPDAGPPGLMLVDDCDRLDATRQQRLFSALNRVREQPERAIVLSGAAPPGALALRDDLKSRLAWGLVIEVVALSDADKAQALRRQAAQRGVTIGEDVIPWLLVHTSRDMRALSALLAALDRHALTRQRAITLALVREVLRG